MLPEIVLDDRRFQELVSEARTRIALTCPEWTEHNVSDPGITLIELFAWMTEMLIYRVNRIPDKLHVALLNLLGMQLGPPSCATTEVRFSLAGAADEPVEIPAGAEIATVRTSDEPAIVFQLIDAFTIPALRPATYAVQRNGQIKDVGVADGRARPALSDQTPFGTPPQPGDALLIGFAEPIGRLVMRVEVDGSQARGAGVDPTDPPLRWEVSTGDGAWIEETRARRFDRGLQPGQRLDDASTAGRQRDPSAGGTPAALAALPDPCRDAIGQDRGYVHASPGDPRTDRGAPGRAAACGTRRRTRARADRGGRGIARSRAIRSHTARSCLPYTARGWRCARPEPRTGSDGSRRIRSPRAGPATHISFSISRAARSSSARRSVSRTAAGGSTERSRRKDRRSASAATATAADATET